MIFEKSWGNFFAILVFFPAAEHKSITKTHFCRKKCHKWDFYFYFGDGKVVIQKIKQIWP
jgi:hypothetical protein